MSQDPRFPTAPSLRLRRFLYERGLRLEPWATQEHILEAFLDHLAHEGHDDTYWEDLTLLATELARDLQRHRPESALVQAMNLDCEALMREIRAALATSRTDREGHRSLGRRITGSAMSLLLLVTLVAVACGGETRGDESPFQSPPGTGGTGGNSATTGGSGNILEVTGGIGGLRPIQVEIGGTPVDVPPHVVSGAPSWGGAGGAGGCIPEDMTIRGMIEACITDSAARNEFLSYLEASHPQWSTFIRDYFRCETCGDLAEYMDRCRYSDMRVRPSPPNENDNIFDFCPPVLIYAGVRFS